MNIGFNLVSTNVNVDAIGRIDIVKAKAGDKVEQDKLFKQCLPLIKFFSKKNNGSVEEDLLQELCLKLMTDVLQGFDPKRGVKFTTYFYQCATNLRNAYYKKQQSEKYTEISMNNFDEELPTIDECINIEKDYCSKLVEEKVTKLALQLKGKHQYAIIHYFGLLGFEAMNMTEISNKLGCSRQYIAKIVKKNLKELKKMLINEELLEVS